MRRAKRSGADVILFLSFFAGAGYSFGAYSQRLASMLDFTQSQIYLVPSLGGIGVYFGTEKTRREEKKKCVVFFLVLFFGFFIVFALNSPFFFVNFKRHFYF